MRSGIIWITRTAHYSAQELCGKARPEMVGTALRGKRSGADELVVHRPVVERLVGDNDFQSRGRDDLALDQRLRERVFDVLLQRAAQRPGSVGAVCAGLLQDPARGFRR